MEQLTWGVYLKHKAKLKMQGITAIEASAFGIPVKEIKRKDWKTRFADYTTSIEKLKNLYKICLTDNRQLDRKRTPKQKILKVLQSLEITQEFINTPEFETKPLKAKVIRKKVKSVSKVEPKPQTSVYPKTVEGIIREFKTESKIDPASNNFLRTHAWRVLRVKVLEKYGKKCMCCGSTLQINVDHIKPRKHFPELALVESNLQVLCAECNKEKGNWDTTDYRPKTNN